MLSKTAVVLLAAGNSSRLGKSKQALLFRGKSMLQNAVDAALKSHCFPVIVVLGSEANLHRNLIKNEQVTIVFNAKWQEGMGTSLSCGMNYLVKNAPGCDGVVIMVCDQPFTNSAVLNSLLETKNRTGKGIVACAYAGTTGTPALFSSRYFDDLQRLTGQKGAKSLFFENRNDLETINFSKGEVDIDTLQDYISLLH